MKDKAVAAGIYGMLHFMVDFCCAFFIFGMSLNARELYQFFLIYNFCAFALQMPAGLLADRFNRNLLTAAAGCFLTAAVPLIYTVMQCGLSGGVLPVILVGLGNCLFHVGGGIEILNKGQDKLWPLGIFVSPGAVGIFFGSLLGKETNIPAVLPYVILFSGAFILLLWQRKSSGGFSADNEIVPAQALAKKGTIITALLCFFLVVVLRSHLGMIYSFPWKKEALGGFLCLLGVVSGKAAGGILADRFGIGRTGFWSMLFACVCFAFAQNKWFGIAGIFFFNMSMPITLFLAAELLDKDKGFAFGILTFAIFIGFLPAYLGYLGCTPRLLVIYSFCSLVLLISGCRLMQRKESGI